MRNKDYYIVFSYDNKNIVNELKKNNIKSEEFSTKIVLKKYNNLKIKTIKLLKDYVIVMKSKQAYNIILKYNIIYFGVINGKDIDRFKNRLHLMNNLQKFTFNIGDLVEINDGVFKGMQAIIDNIVGENLVLSIKNKDMDKFKNFLIKINYLNVRKI